MCKRGRRRARCGGSAPNSPSPPRLEGVEHAVSCSNPPRSARHRAHRGLRVARGRARRCGDRLEHGRQRRDLLDDTDGARRRRSAPRWCRAPSTTRSTRSPAATSRICRRRRADPTYSQDAAAATAAFRVVRESRPGAADHAADAVRRVAGGDRRRPGQGRRHRGRRGGGHRDARRPRRRRPQRAVHVRDRHHAGRVAAVAAVLPARPHTVGRQRQAVPGPQRPDAAHGRAQPPQEPRLRAGPQRGEVARLADEHDADAGSDDGGHLLAVAARRAVRRRHAVALGALRIDHRGERPPVRHGEPRRGRRGDRVLVRQVRLELLAADRRDPRGRLRRQPGDRGPTRAGRRCSTRRRSPSPPLVDAGLPGPPVRSHLREQRDAERDARLLRHRSHRLRHRELALPHPAEALRALLAAL